MYYGSGTVVHTTSNVFGGLTDSRHGRKSWLLPWKYNITSKIRLCQSMHIYLKNY